MVPGTTGPTDNNGSAMTTTTAATTYSPSYTPLDIGDCDDDWHTSDDETYTINELPKVASWRLVLALAAAVLLVAVGTTVTTLRHTKANVSAEEPAVKVAKTSPPQSEHVSITIVKTIPLTPLATTTPPVPSRATAVTTFINRIKLSDGTLAVPETSRANSTTSEDAALAWLIYDNPLQLSPDSETSQFRLQQRYALLTLLLQFQNFVESTKWFTSSDSECNWKYVSSCTNATAEQQPQVTGIYINHFGRDSAKEASLPLDLGLLTNLVSLQVIDSSLTKTIPSSLGTAWTNLKLFAVGSNALWGSLPPSLGSTWTNLETFNVASNHLAGILPSTMGATWTHLVYFSVSGNYFMGSIPSSVNNWKSIQTAKFKFNSFVGSMPSGLCDSKQQRDLEADCAEVACPCCTMCCLDTYICEYTGYRYGH